VTSALSERQFCLSILFSFRFWMKRPILPVMAVSACVIICRCNNHSRIRHCYNSPWRSSRCRRSLLCDRTPVLAKHGINHGFHSEAIWNHAKPNQDDMDAECGTEGVKSRRSVLGRTSCGTNPVSEVWEILKSNRAVVRSLLHQESMPDCT
jgi:hypothetical protein